MGNLIVSVLLAMFCMVPMDCFAWFHDDTTRWVWLDSNDEVGIFYDKPSIKTNSIGGDIWVCYFNVSKGEEMLVLISVNTDTDYIGNKAILIYDSKGEVKKSFDIPYVEYKPVIPGTVGEQFVKIIKQEKGFR